MRMQVQKLLHQGECMCCDMEGKNCQTVFLDCQPLALPRLNGPLTWETLPMTSWPMH